MVIPGPVRGMGHGTNAPWNFSNVRKNLGRIVAVSTSLKSGHPITAQVATIDGFSSVASYYSLGRRFHYHVPVGKGD